MINTHSKGLPGRTGSLRSRGGKLSLAVLSVLLILAMTLPALAETVYPKPTNYIADDAAILSESTVREIKEKNDTLISEVKAVIAVCTVKTTDGVDIGKYARSVYTEWKLPVGVLILIASEDNAFYLVQSASIGDKITNEDLEGIRDREIEEDFAAGNVDRAVRKAVSQLSILMLKELKPEEEEAGTSASAGTEASADAQTTPAEEKKSAGSIVVKILKALLIIVLVLAAAFVILFVFAMFNDDAAAFMQKTFFRKNSGSHGVSPSYYDDRLYDDPRRQTPRNRPAQNPNGQRQYPVQSGGQRPRNPQQVPAQYQNQYQQYPNQQYQVQQAPVQYQNQQFPAQYQQRQYPAQYQQRQYQNPQQYPAQYPNQQQFSYQNQAPRQVPQQNASYNARQTARPRQNRPAPQSSQPYSAENDPNVIRQKQAQSQGDPSATQTYTIPGRGGY